MSYKIDQWNSWTEKSSEVPFKSSSKNGDGEIKLATEYETQPLGQNYQYDLYMPFGEKWECKKLDSADSFRIGVSSYDDYMHIIMNVFVIFKKITNVKNILIDGSVKSQLERIVHNLYHSSNRRMSLMSGIIKHEISESNLNKASVLIEELKQITSYTENREIICIHLSTVENTHILQKTHF